MARAGWSLAPDDDAAEMYLCGPGAAGRGRVSAVRDLERRAAGRESRHNLKYWTDGEWLGFGCGAHSTRGGVRWKNVVGDRGLHRACRRRQATGGRAPRAAARRTRWRRRSSPACGLHGGVDIEAVGARYGIDVWDDSVQASTPFVDGWLCWGGQPAAADPRGHACCQRDHGRYSCKRTSTGAARDRRR